MKERRGIMADISSLVETAIQCGFTRAGELNMGALEFMPEVRDMCSADRCNSYGKRWVCPPAVGSLEEITEIAAGFDYGILVQTVGNLEDDFDYETIEETMKLHDQNFLRLQNEVAKTSMDILPMGAGSCSLCNRCTYPEAPCRFPERAFPSMEAYGLLVSKVCGKSGMPYYSGKQTITFTSCFLLKGTHDE